jgi:hypothetical protein
VANSKQCIKHTIKAGHARSDLSPAVKREGLWLVVIDSKLIFYLSKDKRKRSDEGSDCAWPISFPDTPAPLDEATNE